MMHSMKSRSNRCFIYSGGTEYRLSVLLVVHGGYEQLHVPVQAGGLHPDDPVLGAAAAAQPPQRGQHTRHRGTWPPPDCTHQDRGAVVHLTLNQISQKEGQRKLKYGPMVNVGYVLIGESGPAHVQSGCLAQW